MMSEDEQSEQTIEKFQKAVKLTAIMRQKPSFDDEMQKAQKALIKPYQLRNADDFESIERVMIKVKFFTKVKLKYGLLVFKEVCKHLYYKRAQPDHIIIRVNNEGKAFYVILKGSVGINIFLPKTLQKKPQNKGIVNVEEVEVENEPFEYQEVNVLSNGDSFGEVALLDPTSKTTATVITKEICEFACLDKEQFSNILGALNQAEMNEKMSFVRNIHFLKGWFENDLKTLSFHFELVYYERNDVIYKEGEQLDGYLYFLKKGEVSLMKSFQRNFIQVCNLCVGEIFGEEMYLNNQARFHSAICNVQDTQVYKLSKADLERRMWQSENRSLFKESIALRWEWRNKRFETLKVLETKVEQEENLQQYLKPKTEITNDSLPLKFLSQPSTTKVSSQTFTRPFNFMEPEATVEGLMCNQAQNIQFQNKIKARLTNCSRQSQRITNHKKQLSLTLNNAHKRKDSHFEKAKRVNIQQFKSFLLHKFASEELISQQKLPFNFINQDTINEEFENQQKTQSKPQSQQKQLYEEALMAQKQKTPIKLPFANLSKFSNKESKDTSFKKQLDLICHRKSPSNQSYELAETKNSFKYKRMFQF